jgi:alkanesulfonate monooxygenase SsuD/methylene tetrahydromethanopterin reductase-like flavin-dependent oxidoreductase (luciferase family)
VISSGRAVGDLKIGLILPLFSGDPARVLEVAVRAERLGYDGVFVFDHLFPPGAPSDRRSLEAFATLAAVAASTRRITLGTLVTRASLRPAGMIAKLGAALDDISRGRMVLGIGTGDAIDLPEHETYGIPYLGREDRRRHLVETVRAVKALFAGREWEGGDLVPPLAGPVLPRPVTPGGPPVWIGGFTETVVRIAAGEADAWNGWGMSIPEFAERVRVLRTSAEEAGREVEATWAGIVVVGRTDDEAGALLARRSRLGFLETNVWVGSGDSLVQWLSGLREVGATWAVLVAAGPPDRIDLIAETVLPRVRT